MVLNLLLALYKSLDFVQYFFPGKDKANKNGSTTHSGLTYNTLILQQRLTNGHSVEALLLSLTTVAWCDLFLDAGK